MIPTLSYITLRYFTNHLRTASPFSFLFFFLFLFLRLGQTSLEEISRHVNQVYAVRACCDVTSIDGYLMESGAILCPTPECQNVVLCTAIPSPPFSHPLRIVEDVPPSPMQTLTQVPLRKVRSNTFGIMLSCHRSLARCLSPEPSANPPVL